MSSLRIRRSAAQEDIAPRNECKEKEKLQNGNFILNQLDNVVAKDDVKLHSRADRHLLTAVHWFILVTYCCAAFILCFNTDAALPQPYSGASKTRFSESRAKALLEGMADFGSKPSGSYAAEVLTRNFIAQEIERIKFHADPSIFHLETDVQKSSDCYEFHFISGYITCYKNITNIVVKLSPYRKATDYSVLINCHFDSVVGSPGATDDLAACAVMLEMLNVLSQGAQPFKHSLIFLFNGAEENFLQGSHAFITKHRWRHSVRGFINLEGAGAGGREFLFQSGPANMWLLHAYLDNAQSPHGSILAQEVFESGIIISDTDFRVFRDYGRLSGLDVAFTRNSYLYHTEFDDVAHIPPGSLQRLGDNILATVANVANSTCLAKPCPELEARIIFFDVLGYFVVKYSSTCAVLINYAVCLLVVLKIYAQIRNTPSRFSLYNGADGFRWSLAAEQQRQLDAEMSFCSRDLLIQTCVMLVSLLAAGCALALMLVFVNLSGLLMFWHGNWLLLPPVYVLPPVYAALCLHWWVSRKLPNFREKRFFAEQLNHDVALGLLAVILFAVTFAGIQSSYFVLVHLLFPLLRDPLILLITVSRRKRKTANVVFMSQLLCLIPVALVGSYALVEVLHAFIPLMGRSGMVVNPELLVGAVCFSVSLSLILFTSNFVYISSKFSKLLKLVVAVNVITLLLMLFPGTVEPFTFSDDAPRWRRLFAQHVRRRLPSLPDEKSLMREESGVWLVPLDFRGSADLPRQLNSRGAGRSVNCSGAVDAFCALPYYIPARKVVPPNCTVWLPAGSPEFSRPVRIDLKAKKRINSDRIVINMTIDGADHINAYFTPMNSWYIDYFVIDSKMVDLTDVPETHFVYLANVQTDEPWTISVAMFTTLEQRRLFDEPILYVGAASHEMHGKFCNSKTLIELSKLIAKRRRNSDPDYHWKWAMTVNSWTSDYVGKYVNYS